MTDVSGDTRRGFADHHYFPSGKTDPIGMAMTIQLGISQDQAS